MSDAGWTALSIDHGTAEQRENQHFGLVAHRSGELIPDLRVLGLTQEHGVLGMRPGSALALPEIPVGTPLRILPVHACATAFQHDAYHVIDAPDDRIQAVWPRIRGW